MSQVVWPDIEVYLDTTSAPLSATDFSKTGTTTLARIDAIDGGDCLISFQTHRGRSTSQSHFDSGTLTIEFNNKTGFLDPTYTSGPFYGHLGVGNHISIYARTANLWIWSGYIQSFSPQYDYTGGERMVITAVDMLSYLALTDWPLRTTFAPDTADDIIRGILTDCGFSSSWVTGDVGNSLIQAPLDDPENPGSTTNALAVIQAAAEDSEGGLVFMNGKGLLQFWNRYKRDRQSGATTLTLTDDGSSVYEYEPDIAPVMDTSLMINGMTVTDALGRNYTYQDAASIAKNGPLQTTLSNLMYSPNEGYDLAAWTVQTNKDMHLRVDQVTVRPAYTSQSQWSSARESSDSDGSLGRRDGVCESWPMDRRVRMPQRDTGPARNEAVALPRMRRLVHAVMAGAPRRDRSGTPTAPNGKPKLATNRKRGNIDRRECRARASAGVRLVARIQRGREPECVDCGSRHIRYLGIGDVQETMI